MPEPFSIQIIGERINPGFQSTRALFDHSDIPGIQGLAARQATAGAACLNVNLGTRALTDESFVASVIKAIQDATNLPLSFDSPAAKVQQTCFTTYDADRAQGRQPILNSITEHRWGLTALLRDFPSRVILMASERVEGGAVKVNKTAQDIYRTCLRGAERLCGEHGVRLDDIFLDMSISSIVADTEGLNHATLEAIAMVGSDANLRGIHMMGGLSNIGQHLPPKALDGSDLKHALECAFLTLAVPQGFDTILATPWCQYAPLPEDHFVLGIYRKFLHSRGRDALLALRSLFRR